MKPLFNILLLVVALSFGTPCTFAKTVSLPEIIETVEARRGWWQAFKSDLKLTFSTAQGSATCQGSLKYQRMDEKVLLHCYDPRGHLLLGLQSEDRFFNLYLPRQNLLVSGDVFDLRDSAEIDLHINPLELYRALKSEAFFEKTTKI